MIKDFQKVLWTPIKAKDEEKEEDLEKHGRHFKSLELHRNRAAIGNYGQK